MARGNLDDLLAFLAVARERNFTRAAAKLGVSQSALSHTMRGLEARLGLRLLTRTTRSVAPTEAGERLLQSIGPRFDEIDSELAALSELREKPAGTIRITAGEHAAEAILWVALAKLLPNYPDIKVEIVIDHGLTDIVAERYDAGVRLGEQVAEEYDCRADWPGYTHGRRRCAFVFHETPTARDAAGSDRPRSHQHPSANPWRTVCLGVREKRALTKGAGRRAGGIQQHCIATESGTGRVWPGILARGPRAVTSRQGTADPGAC